jgi:RND family efflux transporter MFP subunit
MSPRTAVIAIAALAGTLVTAESAAQQGEAPPAPVGYTEALERPLARSVQLPGYVESPKVSRIASEVEGLILEFLVREGDRVEKGQPLVRLKTAPLELQLRAAQAELAEAEARREMADRNLVRSKDLFEKKTVAQQQLDESQSELYAWEGRARLLQARIARIQLDIENSTVKAPFKGIVTVRQSEVGEWSEAGAELLELLSLDELEVHVDVPEQYFGVLHPQSAATVTFDYIPGASFDAAVRAVIPRADDKARTFPVKLKLGGADPRIGVGMLARVDLPVGQAARAVLVPKDALVRQGPAQIVYVINGDDTISPVPVSPGPALGGWISISGAVQAGQKIVTRGNERVQPGQKVSALPVEYEAP